MVPGRLVELRGFGLALPAEAALEATDLFDSEKPTWPEMRGKKFF